MRHNVLPGNIANITLRSTLKEMVPLLKSSAGGGVHGDQFWPHGLSTLMDSTTISGAG